MFLEDICNEVYYYVASQFTESSSPVPYTRFMYLTGQTGLSATGQPPEQNCYDYFHAGKAAVRIKLIRVRKLARFDLATVMQLNNIAFPVLSRCML